MKIEDCIAALQLPAGALVHQRVPKKLLLENGAPTAADKRYINEGIEDIHWIAALKPSTIGVAEYRDATKEYLEVAVLSMKLRASAKLSRLVELVHRAIPYPVLLFTEQADAIWLSTAHLRWSQAESGKTVMEDGVLAVQAEALSDGTVSEAFALSRQPSTSLYALYQGWVDVVLALQTMKMTGTFAPACDTSHSLARRAALQECARIEKESAQLRVVAAKEKQVAKKVDLNLKLKDLQAAYAEARAKL